MLNRNPTTVLVTFGSIFTLIAGLAGVLVAQQIGDTPAISAHLEESDIESGRVPFPEVIDHGRRLFTAIFNKLDGQGRPADSLMSRPNGPDAHSWTSCHNRPR